MRLEKENMQIQPNEISTGVSLEDARRRTKEIFQTVIRPQVEEDRKLSVSHKKIKLSAEQKIYANCHSPY